MGTTGFYFVHDTNKFKIYITSIKIHVHERRRDLIHLKIILLKNIDRYCAIVGLLPTSQATSHHRATHITTIVIHLVEYNSHFENNVSMFHHAYVLYAISLLTHLLNSNILEITTGKIETPWPKLFSSNHCIRQDDAHRKMGTAPYAKIQTCVPHLSHTLCPAAFVLPSWSVFFFFLLHQFLT